jgi:hypothetical protein
MSGDPDHALSSEQLPRCDDRETIRAQVHADAVESHRDIDTIVDQQLRLVDGCEPLHLLREAQQVSRRQIALTQLNGTHTGRQCTRQHIEEWAPASLLAIGHEQQPARQRRHQGSTEKKVLSAE